MCKHRARLPYALRGVVLSHVFTSGKAASPGRAGMQVAVNEAREKVADPEFQSTLEKYLEQLCKKAGDYENMCVDSIQQYAPVAFAMALDYLNPVTVCVSLVHVCPAPPHGASV
jgi:hypothetical protein